MEIPIEAGTIQLPADAVAVRDVSLAAGDFLHFVAHQQGVDVVIRLRDAAGTDLKVADSPYGAHGPDEMLFLADAAGDYRLVVEAGKAGAEGEVACDEPVIRPAGDRERRWVRADDLFRQGRASVKAGDRKAGIVSLKAALGHFRDLDLERRQAETLDALGIALEKTDPKLALAFLDRGAALFDRVGEPRRQALALDRAGLLSLQLDRPDAAAAALQSALTLYLELGMDSPAGLCEGRLGSVRLRQGRVEESLEHFERGLDLLGEASAVRRASLLVDLAGARVALHQPAEALSAYEEAAALVGDGGPESIRLTALAGRAAALADLGRTEEAAGLVAAISDWPEPEEPAREHVNARLTAGQVEERLGHLDAARRHFDRALALAEAVDSAQSRATAHLELGYLAVLEGQPRRGLPHFDAATRLYAEAGDQPRLAAALGRKAEALRRAGEPREAIPVVGRALDEVEAVRRSTGRRDVRLDYFGSRQSYYDLAVELHLDLGEPEAALRVHERRRAAELKSTLLTRSRGGRAERAAQRARENELEERLVALAARTPAAGPDPEIQRTLGELYQVRAGGESAAAGSETAAPPAFDLDTFRRRDLDADSLVLVYALGEDDGHLWSFAKAEPLATAALPGRAALRPRIEAFERAVRDPSAVDPELPRRMGAALSETLFGPVRERLGERRLVLVLDGPLLGVPFAALPEPGSDPPRYLVENHEIVVLPSLTALDLLRGNERHRTPAPKTLAVFADAVFSAEDPRVEGGAQHGAGTGEAPDPSRSALEELGRRAGVDPFERLPGTRREADTLRRLLPESQTFVATDFDADRATFLALRFSDYRILHLATHAVPDPTYPALSRLVLSMVDRRGEPRNGSLRAFEIEDLDLPLELVTLSACQTGVGRVIPGEGVQALARAFLDAGATRVVASLWKVGDEPTSRLMGEMYEGYLQRGSTASAALRRAQRALLAEPATASPYNWAGFVLEGDWRRPPSAVPGPSDDGAER